MRLLTLIRHAKSSHDDPDLSDFDRPLNARGSRDAPEMAHRVSAELEKPLLLVSSPAVRALSTAEHFADALAVPHARIQREPRIYEATAGTLLEIVRGLPDGDHHAVLFGHNPGFSDCARLLLENCPFVEMPTCAVVTIELPVASWRRIDPGEGRLRRYRYPKEH